MRKIIVHTLVPKSISKYQKSLIKIFQVCILNLAIAIIVAIHSQLALAIGNEEFTANFVDKRLYLSQVNTCAPVTPDKIYRFIQGEDNCLVPMTTSEIEENLNDPFAENILRADKFPESVSEIVQQVDNSINNFQHDSYLVGEGTQIPLTTAPREAQRNLRYTITFGPSKNNAQIFLSASPGGDSSFHQVVSWDSNSQQYNFYERAVQKGITDNAKVWSWAGNSSLARRSPTKGQGCFDCHHNGAVIMKELESPWNNWQSQLATISPTLVPTAVAQEALFQNLTGAEVLEGAIQSSVQNYYNQWLRERYQRNGETIQLSDVDQMLRHLTTNTTINFKSTSIQSNRQQTSPADRDIDGIPNNFLIWDKILRNFLNVDYTIPNFTFQRDDYDAYLQQRKFELIQTQSTAPLGEVGSDPIAYQKDGSTYFSFFVPVPSFEDTYMATQLKNADIVTDKFMTALLMVDFKNPVFSQKRSSLQKYAAQITSGTIDQNKTSSVPDEFAQLVNANNSQPACTLENFDNCSAEQQFLYIWNLPGNQWQTIAKQLIQQYFDQLNSLTSKEQLNQLMALSIKRRGQFQSATWKPLSNLDEFSLLLPYVERSPS
ncbi:MAG: hypothetical protein AAGE84_21000 [Cyanobacteria bacterium P01_G01_bin.39]